MRKGTCKHFNGSLINKTCEAGVCYRDVTPLPDEPGSAIRIPCTPIDTDHSRQVIERHGPKGTCDKFEEFTDEELAEQEREMEQAMQRMMKTLPLIGRIKKEHKGKQWAGVEECPACGGRLHLSHAACNGHVWGKCETEGCLAWME